jgi:hypothetical protein
MEDMQELDMAWVLAMALLLELAMEVLDMVVLQVGVAMAVVMGVEGQAVGELQIFLEREEVLGAVEELAMAQQEMPQATGAVVLVPWLAMEVQVGAQVGLELLQQQEALQDMVVLVMAMEAVKVVMGLLQDMEGEAAATELL